MITVLCPTRGRPGQAGEMVDSFLATSVLEDTRLVLVVDEDDPDVSDYLTLRPVDERFLGSVLLAPQWTGDLVRATNSAASAFWDADCILGHVGDDHRFRTEAWDEKVGYALLVPGVAYGDDGYQHENMPTAVFISSVIPRTLGWYALPSCRHLFIDNAWKVLGSKTRLTYLPDVLIEHMHPAAKKGTWDASYLASNSKEMFAHDSAAYDAWMRDRLPADVSLLQEMLP